MDKISKINIAKRRIALNNSFDVSLLDSDSNVFIKSTDIFFEMITFGKQGLFLVNEEIYDWCVELFAHVDIKKIMDGDYLYTIESKLREYNKKLGGEQVRYLYLNPKEVEKPLGYTYRIFNENNIHELDEHKEFHNALNFKNDVVALGAYVENQLIALAGADNVLNDLWQIGVDTLENHRCKGLALYLVKTIADEIEKKGRLPYYTTWSPNIASTKVAIKVGFEPAWIEYFSKELIEDVKNDKSLEC